MAEGGGFRNWLKRLLGGRDPLGAALDLEDAHSVAKLGSEIANAISALGAFGAFSGQLGPQLASAGVGPNQLCAVACVPLFYLLRKRSAKKDADSDDKDKALMERLEEIKQLVSDRSLPGDERVQRLEEKVGTLYRIMDHQATKEYVDNEIRNLQANLGAQNLTIRKASQLLRSLAERDLDPTQGPTAQSFFANLNEGIAALRQEVAGFRDELRDTVAPPIYVPTPTDEPNRYRYRDQATPLVGRKAEQSTIREFLNYKKPAAWMLVRGGAGSGKSRLGLWALEEAQRLGYRAGFLHDGDLDDWHRWRVHQDTLVVVDYVQRRTGDIGEAIRAAARANPAHKLRFLLLERDAVGTWYSNLGKANEDKYTPGGATAYFWMDLSRMDRPGVVEVFTELLRSDPIAGRDAGSLADQFLTIEPDGRPLFAAFYFEAVAKGEEVDGWSRTDLARWVLTHELDERWRPVGIDAEYGHLATVASALRGVTKEFCDSVPCLAPYLPRWEKDKCNVIGSLGGGYEDAPKPRVPALDPDSIAELYILDRLAGAADLGQGVGQAAETKKVLDCLWGEAGSHETLVELVRHCAQSYAGHEMLAKIQDAPDSVPEAVRESLKIQVAAVAAASGASLQEVVGAAGATLAEAAEALPQGGTMLLAQAYFQEAFDREGTVAGRVALDALRALAAANPDEPEVRLALAQALFNATVGREMTEEGQAALADLRKLAEEHPDEPEVRLALAQALTNAVGHLAEDGPRQGALAELRALAEEHPDEPEVRLALAKALNNAVFKLKTDVPRQAGLAELRTLADAHPDEPKVRLALAQALTNAVLKLGEDGPRQAALADLRKLAEEHPDEP
ncbi:MAG: hypothetical protein IT207_03550, partial [Fimbriimonadaceae bacterium]|nr:hypothetical protein [Fimbriimonadaceae bacterium]